MTDAQTIAAYDDQIDAYLDLLKKEGGNKVLDAFIDRLGPGARVLDLGCGPGMSSAVMRDRGLQVDPTDAASEMVAFAKKHLDLPARQAAFQDIDAVNHYDGIWANFSLLHATREEFPGLLEALFRGIKPGGLFHLAMKLGEGAKRDSLGRFYTYYRDEELRSYVEDVGFVIERSREGEVIGLAGKPEPWIMLSSIARG